jgi:DNA-binding Lrp family transcriptional regulator
MIQLDKKDIAILQELDKNVRASYAQIGRKTRISKETVQYRLKNLEKKKIITGYWIMPKLGNNSFLYKVLFKNKNMTKEEHEEFIRFLTSNKAVSWIASTEGNWDYIITCIVTSDHHFSLMMDKLLTRFGSKFKEKHIIKSTELISLNEKYLYSNNTEIISHHNSLLQEGILNDKKDTEIINELSKDCRASFREIAKNVNLTPEAIAYRFKSIMKNNILTIKPRIDYNALGFSYYHLYIELTEPGMYKKIADYYTVHPRCIFIMKYIGVCDMHLELVLDPTNTHSIIDELITNFGKYLNGYELIKITKEHLIVIRQ